MTFAPIPNAWTRETCVGCGADVRRLDLASCSLILDPTPLATISERFGEYGAVVGYDHRVGYQPHRCVMVDSSA